MTDLTANDRRGAFSAHGKQVLIDGKHHYADAADLKAAEFIADACNSKAKGDWQPIETAPRDPEDAILLLMFEPHDAGGFMFVGTFDHAKSQWFNNLDHETQHPTHWMPLPAAPAGDA